MAENGPLQKRTPLFSPIVSIDSIAKIVAVFMTNNQGQGPEQSGGGRMDDLLTMRMMVVSALHSVGDLYRQASAMASVFVEVETADAAAACAALKTSSFDIVLLDGALAEHDRDAVIRQTRAMTPKPHVALAAPSGTHHRIDGIDGLYAKPAGVDEARTIVERCIGMRVPKRVLIVDESPALRGVVRKILSASRFALEIEEAEGGIDALDKSAAAAEIVLIDGGLPGLDGFETVSRIKRIAPRAEVVMMTPKGDHDAVLRAQNSGAAAVLQKPFFPADIDAVLERIYAKS